MGSRRIGVFRPGGRDGIHAREGIGRAAGLTSSGILLADGGGLFAWWGDGGRGPAVRDCVGPGQGVAVRGGRERIAGGGGAPRQRFWSLRMSLVCSPRDLVPDPRHIPGPRGRWAFRDRVWACDLRGPWTQQVDHGQTRMFVHCYRDLNRVRSKCCVNCQPGPIYSTKLGQNQHQLVFVFL